MRDSKSNADAAIDQPVTALGGPGTIAHGRTVATTAMTMSKSYQADASPGAAIPVTAVNLEHLWVIFRDLRDIRARLGLGAGHLQTLQAMISFLKDGGTAFVFASNRTLARRAGGIDERTLRRHAARLASVGLIARRDSPNGKRYKLRDPDGDGEEVFGFTLAPMIVQASLIEAAAQAQRRSEERCRFLRKRLLRLLALLEARLPDAVVPFRQALRRKANEALYEEMIASAEEIIPVDESPASPSPLTTIAEELSVNDGQTVRHHSMSKKKDMDSERTEGSAIAATPLGSDMTGPDLLGTTITTCSEAIAFATGSIRSWNDLDRLAFELAPMMGIDRPCLERASSRHPLPKVTLTVLLILQLGPKIRNAHAWFRSVMIGRRAESFNPLELLGKIASRQSATPCLAARRHNLVIPYINSL